MSEPPGGPPAAGSSPPSRPAEARDAPRGLDAFFAPRGVAVVGASRTPGKVGNAVVRNLLFGGPGDDRGRGFPGLIAPVNPRASEVLGLPCCASVDDLTGPIDLAVFAVPAPEVPAALDRAARKGIRGAIVLSAGFFEMGPEGRRLEALLRSVAKNTDIRVVGPNCTGIFSAPSRLQASFFSAAPREGGTSLISQSGAIAQALVQHFAKGEVGLRHVVSLGEKIDVDDAALVRHFARDEGTRVIALYVESLDDARALHEAARLAAQQRPLVVLRGGGTGAGHRAAKVHEGILATSDASIEAALAQPGIFRARSLPSFLAAIRALATQPPARGRRVAIVTNAGGAGVIAADAVAMAGLEVVRLRPGTAQRLTTALTNPRATRNPIDLLGDATPDRFLAALDIVNTAEEVDAILLLLTDQAMTDPVEVADVVCAWAPALTKPICASYVASAGQRGEDRLERAGIPVYEFPETAVTGLRALVARGAHVRRMARRRASRPAPVPRPSASTTRAVRRTW